jgi:hypothetical protein
MSQKVVAHYIDHKVIKGTSLDVDPGRPRCHVLTVDGRPVEVELKDLKALYFVKDLSGQPQYDETHRPKPGDDRLRGSRQVEMMFQDGERLGGLMNRYPPNRPFFFVLPMDPESNNIRILVNRDALAELKPVDDKSDAIDTAPGAGGSPSPVPPRAKRTSWVFDGKDIKYVEIE